MTAKEFRKQAREKLFPHNENTGYGTFLLGILRQFVVAMLGGLFFVPVIIGILASVDFGSLKEKMALVPPLPVDAGFWGDNLYPFLSVLAENPPPHRDMALLLLAAVLITICWLLIFSLIKWGQAAMSVALVRGGLQAGHGITGPKNVLRMASLLSWQYTYISLWSLLFFVPGIRAYYSYCMAGYLLIDNPDWSPRKCIAESKRMMEGHRWRFFCLQLSFIGWNAAARVVEKFCGSIAVVLLHPYIGTASAAFYEDMLDREDAKPVGCEMPPDGDFTQKTNSQCGEN